MATITRQNAGSYFVGDDGSNWVGISNGSKTSSTLDGWSLGNSPTPPYYIVMESYSNGTSYNSKVLKMDGSAQQAVISKTFTSEGRGGIEFYIASDDVSAAAFALYGYSGALPSVGISVVGGANSVYAYENPLVDTGFDMVDGVIYHVGIAWRKTGEAAYTPYDTALNEGEYVLCINGTEYGPYNMEVDGSISKFYLYSSQIIYFDAFAITWDSGGYSLGDNQSLLEDAVTISNSNISQLKIHYPTTLEPTNVKFDRKTYEKYYPVCVAKINPSEDIFLGCTIKITDNLTSGGATASSVIFKGEVVKKLTSKASGFIPSYLIFSNAKEMDSIKPEGSYTKDTDGYISDILTNLCDKLTEGTLSDGVDLGTFTAAGDKTFTLIIKQCARFDGYLAYIDSSAGADNADLMYNDGSTDTGVDIDESSSTLRGLRAISQLDEHINKVIVRGGIQSDGTRAEGTASDTTSQGLYGIIPTYDTDTNLNTDALCASKAAQILADNEFGNRKIVLGYKDATKGMLQPGETVTFDWDKDVHDIGFTIEQEQYIIARNTYDVKTGVNVLTLFSSIYYPPISDGELLQETSHVALQNSDNIADLQSGQHDRLIPPTSFTPRNFTTSGANNCYAYEYGGCLFGTNSWTSANGVFIYFDLPDDYMAGENLTLKFRWRINQVSATVDYTMTGAYARGSAPLAQTNTSTSQWTSDATANDPNDATFTITGTNVQAGDTLRIEIKMEDNSGTDVCHLLSYKLYAPVNGRD